MTTRKLPCQYVVTGVAPFPLDMLRSDCCYPVTSADVDALALNEPGARLVVSLRSHVKEPTTLRWSSFGYTVVRGSLRGC